MSKTLDIQQLHIGYQTEYAVQANIQLHAQAGSFICILGANGSGKSTFLKTMGRLLPPLAGKIYYQGQDIAALPPKLFAKTVSMVLTEPMHIPQATAYDIIALGRHPYTNLFGKLQRHDYQKIETAIALTHTQALIARPIDQLSDGERQKVMIAKALAQDTPIILMDEPTAFLDFPSKLAMMTLLQKLAQDTHKIIILSTHDVDSALKTADLFWLFDKVKKEVLAAIPEDMALSNELQRLTSHTQVRFNSASGHFEQHKDYERYVQMSTHDIASRWLSHALHRKGIGTTDKAADWSISHSTAGFLIHNATTQAEILAKDIAAALQAVGKEIEGD